MTSSGAVSQRRCFRMAVRPAPSYTCRNGTVRWRGVPTPTVTEEIKKKKKKEKKKKEEEKEEEKKKQKKMKKMKKEKRK